MKRYLGQEFVQAQIDTRGVLPSNPIALYLMNEGNGKILYDRGINATNIPGGSNGTLGSTASPDANDPDWSGGGLTFATNDYVRIPYNDFLDSSFTFFVVCDIPETPVASTECMLSFGNSADSIPRVLLWLLNSPAVQAVMYDDAGTTVNSSVSLTDKNGVRLFKVSIGDGEMVVTDIISGLYNLVATTSLGTFDNANQAGIGCLYRSTTSFFYNGTVYAVLMYQKVTTAEEDSQIYAYFKRVLGERGVALSSV